MSKPYTEQNLSDILDADLIWRRKELSDMKAAIKASDPHSKPEAPAPARFVVRA
jgi:hypothetical protein